MFNPTTLLNCCVSFIDEEMLLATEILKTTNF